MTLKIPKSLLLVFFFIFVGQYNYSASYIHPTLKNAEGNNENESSYLKASVFVRLSIKEFTILTGEKLNLFQKLYFKTIRHKLRVEVKKNPDLLITQYYDQKKGKFKLDFMWLIIGAIIGPLAILFAFTSKQPKYKKISTILGCLVFIAWFGHLFLF